jgi:hypothetical protein
MNPSELDKAVAYTKQFIDAALPVAKQAYEIGLITLRIDAAQSAVVGLIMLVLAVLGVRKIRADHKAAKAIAALPENKDNTWRKDASNHLPADGFLHVLGALFSCAAGAIALFTLLNVWLWVKLFAPELWLARQAIAKIID